jgi:hypothetical protein
MPGKWNANGGKLAKAAGYNGWPATFGPFRTVSK